MGLWGFLFKSSRASWCLVLVMLQRREFLILHYYHYQIQHVYFRSDRGASAAAGIRGWLQLCCQYHFVVCDFFDGSRRHSTFSNPVGDIEKNPPRWLFYYCRHGMDSRSVGNYIYYLLTGYSFSALLTLSLCPRRLPMALVNTRMTCPQFNCPICNRWAHAYLKSRIELI